MSALTKKHPTKKNNDEIIVVHDANTTYHIPKQVAEQYKATQQDLVKPDDVFHDLNEKYTKPGALLRGLRARENLTQAALAEKIGVTQSDISQMENGTRRIGRNVALRIATLFDVNYRLFLA